MLAPGVSLLVAVLRTVLLALPVSLPLAHSHQPTVDVSNRDDGIVANDIEA
jgi:hypothetical protein